VIAGEALRARLFLRSVLPLLEVVMRARPALARRFAGVDAVVQISAGDAAEAARLRFTGGVLQVEPGVDPSPTLCLCFRDLAALNRFFGGRPGLIWIAGLARHPVLAARVLGLLASLRLLAAEPDRVGAADRALRVELSLYLATHALGQLARAGDPEVGALVADSPDRVYQWKVADSGAAAYLRMHRGRTRAGRGVYRGRRPFVSYTFPTTDAAYRVLTARASQMASVARGDVVPEGSPEYSRAISVLLQRVDQLLTGG